MDLVESVYHLIQALPSEERFGLADQMRRAAVSIPSNIAEGHARSGDKEFRNFLHIASGSRAELQTQILICERVGLLTRAQTKPALLLTEEVGKLLHAFIVSLSKSC